MTLHLSGGPSPQSRRCYWYFSAADSLPQPPPSVRRRGSQGEIGKGNCPFAAKADKRGPSAPPPPWVGGCFSTALPT